MTKISRFATTFIFLFFVLFLLIAAKSKSSSSNNTFNITSFTNSGSPHSTIARLLFHLSSASLTAPVFCSYTQSIQPTIATTSANVPCNDTSVLFGFEYFDVDAEDFPNAGYYLNIAHMLHGNTTVDVAVLYMGDNVSTVVDLANPNGNYQMLVHEADFVLEYTQQED